MFNIAVMFAKTRSSGAVEMVAEAETRDLVVTLLNTECHTVTQHARHFPLF